MAHDHKYRVTASWQGTTAVGYEAYDRTHTLAAPPAAATITASGDPAFRGDANLLNPEQLLVLAAASCQLLSFLAVAARARIEVVAYEDDAVGTMPADDPPARITAIVLRPRITLVGDQPRAKLERLVRIAHDECYIANSVTTEITVEPTFQLVGSG